jgi:NADH-quinone oxidoreductase subunit L
MLSDWTVLRWIPAVPLAAAVLQGVMIGLLRRPLSRSSAAWLGAGSVAGSLLLTGVAFAKLLGLPDGGRIVDRVGTWVGLGVGSAAFNADLAFQFDALTAVMCLIVTGVGLLIHIYAADYMMGDDRDDKGYQRFFCYMNLFVAAMLLLVLADNLLLMFVGWEGVGLCSYLLIAFWYGDEANARAGTKAFVVNRIGDLGFLLGLLLLFWTLAEGGVASISFHGIQTALPVIEKATLALPGYLGGELPMASAIGLCLFIGACGKSAQLPLFVWLPDAMAGPTPVSALIHAATMVTAGIYMLARLSFLYAIAPEASAVIAWTGGLTALLAAGAACAQTDIKKVLAYSTISQLGFMFVGAGCGEYTAAIFHLVTHAFFKATLFMGAGIVILGLHHEQNMLRMGGLGGRFRLTRICMWAGAAALIGVPGFSGFFSKDQLIVSAWASHDLPGHLFLYWIGLVAAGLTAFYAARMMFLTFNGETRMAPSVRREAQEPSGGGMMWSLGTLAMLAALGWLVGLPQIYGDEIDLPQSDSLRNFLTGTITPTSHVVDATSEWAVTGQVLLASLAGLLSALLLYIVRPEWPTRLAGALPAFRRFFERAYYIDAFYDLVFVRGLGQLSERVLHQFVELRLIDGFAVEGTATRLRGVADGWLKYAQSGLVQVYLGVMVAGGLALLVYLLFWSGG